MTHKNRIYIIGAGFAGRSIAAEVKAKGILGEVVAFLDDDAQKTGTRIEGIPVLGPIQDVIDLLKQTPADEALIAMPGVSRQRLQQLYSLLKKADFSRIRILPGISQIVEGEAHLIQTREIDPEDLLGRNPVSINLKESLNYLRGKRVLVTGAGGSIGNELCRQLLSGGAQRLYLFGHGENSIYEIEHELKILQEEGVGEKAIIVPVIGELQDRDYMNFILKRLKADVIFHSAAYKHVPLMEANPVEAVKNNVYGTRNLVQAARNVGTPRFVFISTDKAVEPINVYGASKLIAEYIVLNNQTYNDQKFMVVRFGNVLGSRGSIVPLLRKQIRKGGPITLTDPRTTRFFMTIPEASSLVLKAGGVGEGGTLYVLDMGKPISIKELAHQMVKFYGFEPEKDIGFKSIGLRAGEKLIEKLHSSTETPAPTEYPRIHKIIKKEADSVPLNKLLRELETICFLDENHVEAYRNRKMLRKLLHTYIPTVKVPKNEPEY